MNMIPRDNWEYRFSDIISAFIHDSGKNNDDNFIIDGLGKSIPVSSGRAAIVIAIKALKIEPGASIGVPLFCCPVVFQSLVSAGCRIRFIDVDPETYCLSPEEVDRNKAKIDALMAVHMFGQLCEVDKISKSIGNKIIIEDCAQAMGSRLNNIQAGAFGSIGVFSFRSGKYVSAGEGGALFAKEHGICERIEHEISRLNRPGIMNEMSHAATVYIKTKLRNRPLYGWIGWRIWGSYNKNTSDTGLTVSRIRKNDRNTIAHRIGSMKKCIERQREIADTYLKSINVDPGMIVKEKPNMHFNRYLFPIRFPSKEARDDVADQLLLRGVDTMKYLEDIVKISRQRYGYRVGDCPESERLSETTLIIPGYYRLSDRDVDYIIESINAIWDGNRIKSNGS